MENMMNPPPPIDVEGAFGNFVKSSGGALVSDIVGASPNFANADYLFRDQGVIAELKCLEKDVLADANCQTEISKATERWIAAGKIPPFWGAVRIQTAKLPPDCQKEFFQIIRKPIRWAIEKANRQIRETKTNLNLPDAKGLLLLVNDGCWSIESEAILYLADITLGARFSSINSVVYSTVNMPAQMPGVDRDVLVWLQAARKNIEPVDGNFLSWMQKGWCSHYESLICQPVPIFEIQEQQRIQDLRFIRRESPAARPNSSGKPARPAAFFEVGKFYVDSLGRKFCCLNLQDESVTLTRFEIHHQGNVLDVVFSQNVKYASYYAPMADSAEIQRLKARYKRLIEKQRRTP